MLEAGTLAVQSNNKGLVDRVRLMFVDDTIYSDLVLLLSFIAVAIIIIIKIIFIKRTHERVFSCMQHMRTKGEARNAWRKK